MTSSGLALAALEADTRKRVAEREALHLPMMRRLTLFCELTDVELPDEVRATALRLLEGTDWTGDVRQLIAAAEAVAG